MKTCLLQSRRFGCIFAKAVGTFQVSEMANVMRAITALDFFRTGAWVLFDMRGLVFEAEHADLDRLRNVAVDPPTDGSERRIALLVNGSRGQALMQDMAAQRDRPGHRAAVFNTMDAAASWLEIAVESGEMLPEDVEALMAPHFASADARQVSNRLVLLRDSTNGGGHDQAPSYHPSH